jgi:hypothetical protein
MTGKERDLIKAAKFGAAYGMGSETFAKAVQESPAHGGLPKEQASALAKAMMAQMEAIRFKVFSAVHDEVTLFPPRRSYKEETIMQYRFGERKPHNGKRLYRLWIDGVWVGDFKSKAERRKVLESTRVLMEEPEAKPKTKTVTFKKWEGL